MGGNYGYVLGPYSSENNRASVTVYDLSGGTHNIEAWFLQSTYTKFNRVNEELLQTTTPDQTIFELDFVPNRVEIYDNSHISGAFFTGALVVASQKGFEKSQYRKFNAKYSKGGDDYAMMSEVMTRRFASDSSIGNFPDLLVIDGGLGQFHAVTRVLDELGITIPVVSIAKGRNRNAGNETFFTRKNPEGFKLSNKQALPTWTFCQMVINYIANFI
jgi:excinuclease UvrABC nuclease subunit